MSTVLISDLKSSTQTMLSFLLGFSVGVILDKFVYYLHTHLRPRDGHLSIQYRTLIGIIQLFLNAITLVVANRTTYIRQHSIRRMFFSMGVFMPQYQQLESLYTPKFIAEIR